MSLFGVQRCMLRWHRGTSQASDRLLVFGLGSVLGLHLLFTEPVSASADFIVNVGTVASVAWIADGLSREGSRLPVGAMLVAILLSTAKLFSLPVAGMFSTLVAGRGD